MFKVCPQCNDEFKTYRTAAIYCGKACHDASMIRGRVYVCAHCETEFRRPNHTIKHAAELRFCSHACHLAWKVAGRRLGACIVCGAEFNGYDGQKACSRECRNAALVTAVDAICEHCGAHYRAFASEAARGRRFCSTDCAHDGMVGAKHPNFRGGRWLKHGRRWQAVRQAVIERDGGCRWCGTERSKGGRSLHVHHIKPRRGYLIIDVANEMDNLVALCSSCHTRVEMATKHDRTSEIPTRLRDQA